MNWRIAYNDMCGRYTLYEIDGREEYFIGQYTDGDLSDLYLTLIKAGIVTKAQTAMDRREAKKCTCGIREEEALVFPISEETTYERVE